MGKTSKGLGQTHQNQCGLGMLFQKLRTGRQCDLGAVVASHTVNSNCDHGVGTQKERGSNIGSKAKNDKSPTLQDM